MMNDLWSQTLGHLRTTTKRTVVEAWFDKIELVGIHGDRVHLRVPDEYFREYIEAHHLEQIRQSLEAITARDCAIELEVAPPRLAALHVARHEPACAPDGALIGDQLLPGLSLPLAPVAPPSNGSGPAATQRPAAVFADGLSPRFSFDAFVVGETNELAVTVARTVAETHGSLYNPLFLHGGVGIGKTHLLHAIGNAARAQDPTRRVRYVAAETFIDDCVHAMRSSDPSVRARLRQQYRTDCDLLLIDDVQFLQGADKTQEEFFHTFNYLHSQGKQIVLSSDRFPTELAQLSPRLRSRFECGLVVELAPPDRDLRIAILRRKAEDAGLAMAHDVVLYLADHLCNNVRELEGALNKLAAHSRITRRPIDLALARQVLGPLIELPSRTLTAEVIQRTVAHQFNLKITDLKGSKRHRSVVVPRMIAMYLTRKHTVLSFPDIGRAFGGRDHSTVIHACRKVEWMLRTDDKVQADVQTIESTLGK